MLRGLERSILRHPGGILGAAVLLTAMAVWLGLGIELRTSRRELVPDSDPDQALWDAVKEEVGEPEPLIVVLEDPRNDPDTERLRELAETLAARIEEHPAVASVFTRVDPDWLIRSLPWLLPPDELEAAVGQARELLAPDGGPPRIGSLADLNEGIAERLRRARNAGKVTGTGDAAGGATRLAELLAMQRRFLEAPSETAANPGALLPDDGLPAGTGFLETDAGDALLLLVSSRGNPGDLAAEQRLVAGVRETAGDLVGAEPGIRYGLTGPPAMTVEEMGTIARDGRRTSFIALLGVTLLALAAFHYPRHAVLGLGVLVAGVIWSLGAVRLWPGYLNMITTALVPILVGIGIDYAVHPLSQFELERRDRDTHSQAIRATFRRTAPAVAVSALTTAGAFACFLFMEFRGFAELGMVAGIGVLLCLVAALLVLPALLVLFGRGPGGERERPALVDRLWHRRAARRVCARPGLVVAAAALLTVAAVIGGTGVSLETSLLELLPPTAESLRYLDRVAETSAAPYFNLVVADDPATLARLRERAEQYPAIAEVQEPSRFLAAPDAEGRAAVRQLRAFLEELRIVEPREWEPGRLEAALAGLEDELAAAADDAFVAGIGETAGALESARIEVEASVEVLTEANTSAVGDGAAELRERLRSLREQLLAGIRSGPPGVDDLPQRIRDRFVTRTGRYVAYLIPSGSIFDPETLESFNAASRALSPRAVGFPVMFEVQSARISGGFATALGAGALVILILLTIGLRRISHVLLAVVPVVVGVAWMLGLMRLLGLPFNFANLVAVPLVLGVGIDAGVHVIHRFRLEGAEGITPIVEHTGRALLIASLTTMVGFGSLALAQHRGMASLGLLLFLGVGTCLLAALVLLPNLLLALGLARR